MRSSLRPRRIASNLLLSGGELLRNRVVEVAPDGMILSIEVVEGDAIDRNPSTEFYNGIMLAGFVNAHSHLELSYLRGAIEPGGGFATFASRIGKVRGAFSEEQRLSAIVRGDVEMQRGGIVAVGDIVNGDSSFDIKGRSDIRYRSFVELFGLNTRDTKVVDQYLSNPMSSLTPHSTYSLNDDIFRSIAAAGRAPLSIHFMESTSELELYEGRGGLHNWYEKMGFKCDFLHYGSPAERIVASVPRDRTLLLVHNCFITQRDIDIITEHFCADVFWVLCPLSNRYISNIKPPVELMRRNGLNIAIGTDSLASNRTLSMLDEIVAIEGVPLVERLDWATRQGARALQFDDLGDIEVGRRPHINILSGIDYQRMELTSQSRITRIV